MPIAPRLDMSEARRRQLSRRGRPEWHEPTSTTVPMLGRYAQERNPGLATDEEMVAVHERLITPLPSQMPPAELAGSSSTEFDWLSDRKVFPYNTHELDSPRYGESAWYSSSVKQAQTAIGSTAGHLPPSYRSHFENDCYQGAVELDSSPRDVSLSSGLSRSPLAESHPISAMSGALHSPQAPRRVPSNWSYRYDRIKEDSDMYGPG